MLYLDKSYTNGIILRRAWNNKQFKLGMENLDICVYHWFVLLCYAGTPKDSIWQFQQNHIEIYFIMLTEGFIHMNTCSGHHL